MKIGTEEFEFFTIRGYNDPWANERMIEIPLARWFIKKHDHKITEVGAVTPYYDKITHEVLDPYDPWPGCIKKGVNDSTYEGQNVLSISTIEHVGHGEFYQEKNPKEAQNALEKIRKASSYLVTWPAKHHIELDDYVSGAADLVMLRRMAFQNWAVIKTLADVRYGSPWSCGNGLYIITNCKELLC